jgi:G3E family GTPase
MASKAASFHHLPTDKASGGNAIRIGDKPYQRVRGLLDKSVGRALEEIAALEPPALDLLVESTGAARPWPLIRALMQHPRYQLRHFIVAVDALNLLRDFDAGAALTTTEPADPALRLAASLLVEQLAFASLIVLTKTDLVEKEALNTMMRHLRAVNPRAAVGLSAQTRLAWADLGGVPPPDLAQLEALAVGLSLDASPAATPGEVDCTIFREVRPFHPQRIYDVCQSQLSTGLYRTKGYLRLASRPGQVLWRAELVLQ